MNTIVLTTALLIGAYLLGSIPSAVWIGRLFFNIDVREHGSHNAGTTNVLRVLGWKAAVPVFAIDIAKGYAAVMLSRLSGFLPDSTAMFALQAGLIVAVVLGHIFPLFAGFRGGKGVATLLGTMLAMAPLPVLCCFGVFVVVVSITRYVSLGSMTAGVCLPLFAWLVFGETYWPRLAFYVLVAVLLIFTHRKNIERLKNRTENKISFRNRKSD